MSDHPQKDEVTRFLVHLIASGFTLVSVDDGGETHDTPDVVTALPHILGVDASSLHVRYTRMSEVEAWLSGRRSGVFWIDIVLGNGPGELCSDYSNRPPLKECIEAWADTEEVNA